MTAIDSYSEIMFYELSYRFSIKVTNTCLNYALHIDIYLYQANPC